MGKMICLLNYTFSSKLRKKGYLFMFFLGIALWVSFSFYSPPVSPELYPRFWSFFFLFSVYFALISTMESLGRDRERLYTEMLFTRPISVVQYLGCWWLSFLALTLFPIIFFMLPIYFYFHAEYGLTSGNLVGISLSFLLVISYSLFFSTLLKGNNNVLLTVVLLFATALTKDFPISNLFPKVNGFGVKFFILFLVLNLLSYMNLKRRFP